MPVDNTPLNIALSGYRSHPYVGGQGVYLHYLSKALSDLGHHIDVISGPPYPLLHPDVNLIELPSLDLYSRVDEGRKIEKEFFTSYANFTEWWSKQTGGFAEPYSFSRRLQQHLNTRPDGYDIVHDNQSLGYGLLGVQKTGVPVVATVHHPIRRDLKLALQAADRRLSRLLLKRWYGFIKMQSKVVSKLPVIITVSEQSRRDIARDFSRIPDTIKVIHNGVDAQKFRPLNKVKRQRMRIITTASSDQPLKGLKYLLLALSQLINDRPELRLIVIGKLNPRGTNAKLIETLDLSERVQFICELRTEEMVEQYAKATLAVVPSLYEGFGFPAAEAMACECPVISTDAGALREVVGEAGVIVPSKDVKQLSNAIRDLLANTEMQLDLGKRGRKRVLEKFSWRDAALSYVDLYKQLISASKTNLRKQNAHAQ